MTLQTDHFSRRGRTLASPEAADAEPAAGKPAKRATPTAEELAEMERLEDPDTCLVRGLPRPPLGSARACSSHSPQFPATILAEVGSVQRCKCS